MSSQMNLSRSLKGIHSRQEEFVGILLCAQREIFGKTWKQPIKR